MEERGLAYSDDIEKNIIVELTISKDVYLHSYLLYSCIYFFVIEIKLVVKAVSQTDFGFFKWRSNFIQSKQNHSIGNKIE